MKSFIRFFRFVLLLLFTSPGISLSAVYYVDLITGNDDNGVNSVTSPWKSIAKVNSMKFLPGDSICFRRGSIWVGQLNINSSGKKSKPITYTAYGKGVNPIIKNPGVVMGSAIKVSASWVIVENFLVREAHEAGIYITDGAEHNIIRNNEATLVGMGIAVDGSNNLVTRNYAHDLTMVVNTAGGDGDDDYGAVGIWLGPVSGKGNASDNEISYNRLFNCIAPSIDYESDGGAIEFYRNADRNYVHHNWGENCNGSFEVGGQGETVSDNVLAYNIMINNGWGGSFHGAGKYGVNISNFRVENNVFFDMHTQNYFIGFNSGTVTPDKYIYRNNIFYCPNFQGISNQSTFRHEYNLYYLGGKTEVGYTLGSGEIVGDPLFVSSENKDFRLRSASPAINTGTNLKYKFDYPGNSVPIGSAPDMGALEFTLNKQELP